MAYKNLVAEAVATRAEVFKRLRDWLCKRNGSYDYSVTGLGWTLHDAVYAVSQDTISANDYFVVYSAGESGKEDIYVKIIYSSTTTAITVQAYQYWDAATHTGVNGMTAVNNWVVQNATSGTLYIYGDLDAVFVNTLLSTNQYALLFGHVVDTEYDSTVAISSASVASGTGVAVTLDIVPASWAVGKTVVIRDNANIERIIISDITGSVVTFTNVIYSYGAGCKFSRDYIVGATSTSQVVSSFIVNLGHNNVKQATTNIVAPQSSIATSGDPDGTDGDHIAFPVELADTASGYYGRFYSILGISTAYTHLSAYTTDDGVSYRAFINVYSGQNIAVKEV